MKSRFLLGLVPLTALLLCVAGCDEQYSDAVQYTPRTDPVPLDKPGDLFNFPDPPGQFPLLSTKDFFDERNPYFEINKKKDLLKTGIFRDPTQISESVRGQIKQLLDKMFGSPAKPTVAGIDDAARSLLKLSDEELAKGSRYYRVHCLHCHGVTGDGRGPTGRWVNPHPRDYRQGRFKFQSVDQTEKQLPPHRDDLLRTLEHGIEGTAMPSFVLLSPGDREALVSYVIHLSLRGRVEFDILKQAINNKLELELLEGYTLESQTKEFFFKQAVDDWIAAQSRQIKVSDYPYKNTKEDFTASVKRGQEIFSKGRPDLNLGTNVCATCHVDYGRQSQFRFDDWGTFSKPNNLLSGVFRGGRRPVDIYYRIHSGIQPSGMISFGKALEKARAENKNGEDPLWDLVNFVSVLGNPTMRKSCGIYLD